MPKARKKKIKVFGEKLKEMKDFTKQNDLDLNNEKELLRAVKYYDTL